MNETSLGAFNPNQPAKIEEAYKELSQEAFSVWIRLMVTPDDQLVGRSKLAKRLGHSTKRFNEVLRELKLKGYVTFIKDTLGKPTTITILRAAMISGRNRFIFLSQKTEFTKNEKCSKPIQKPTVFNGPKSGLKCSMKSECPIGVSGTFSTANGASKNQGL